MTGSGRRNRGWRRLAALLLLTPLAGGPARGATPEEAATARVEAIRTEAAALRQSLTEAAGRGAGEGRAIERRPLFESHRDLLAPETLDFLRGHRAALTDSTEMERLRALTDEVGRLLLESRVAELDDRGDQLRHTLTAEIEGLPGAVTLPQLDEGILTDPDSLQVRMMMSARSGLWQRQIDPVYDARRIAVDSLATVFGFGRYDSLAAGIRRVDFGPHLLALFRFFRATDSMYRILGTELLVQQPGEAGGPPPRLSTLDLDRLAVRHDADRYLDPLDPAGLLAAVAALAGSKRAASLSFRPVTGSGFAAGRASLRRAGEEFQRGLTDETDPIIREAGCRVAPMAAGALFDDLTMTPAWYEARRAAAPAGSPLATLTAQDLARLVRWQIWCRLYELRTVLGGEQVYELMRHRAPEPMWAPYIFVPVGSADEHALYRQILSFARGVGFTNDDGWNAFEPRLDFGERADVTRGIVLAAIVEAKLRSKFGDDWFTKPEAGSLLEADLLSRSAGIDPDSIARLWGAPKCDFSALQHRYEELFDWSEKLLEGAR